MKIAERKDMAVRNKNEKTPKTNQGFFREIELSLFFGRIRLTVFQDWIGFFGLFHSYWIEQI